MIQRHGLKGLTLLELTMALGIACVLALISVPVFVTFIQNYRISANADNLYYYLQYAKTQAVATDTTVYVSFHEGDTWCYGINSGSACDCTVANNCGLATVSFTTAQQQSLTTSGFTNSTLAFEGSHAEMTTSGTITFTVYNQNSPYVKLSVGRMGGIQMCSTGISGYTAC